MEIVLLAIGMRMKPLYVEHKGFTLMELLIVIVIISIVSSVALMTLSYNSTKNIESFAHQLMQVVTLAEHEAMLRPATLGVAFTKNSYQFYDYDLSSKWQLLHDNDLKKYSIPQNIQITLQINHEEVALNGKPVVIISQSSDITPFVILLSERGKSPCYQVIGNANGALTVEPL
jgi:general secretion pathway protein H